MRARDTLHSPAPGPSPPRRRWRTLWEELDLKGRHRGGDRGLNRPLPNPAKGWVTSG